MHYNFGELPSPPDIPIPNVGRVYGAFEFHGRCRLFPFLDHNAPTLGMLADFAEDAYDFLGESEHNVVGLHCKVWAAI